MLAGLEPDGADVGARQQTKLTLHLKDELLDLGAFAFERFRRLFPQLLIEIQLFPRLVRFPRFSVRHRQAVVGFLDLRTGNDSTLVRGDGLGQIVFFRVKNAERQKGLTKFGIETDGFFKQSLSFGWRAR
jgi:hypothetical protein